VSCRLDYCNALLYGISDDLIQRLQSVQNAAARLVTGAGRRGHITPVLRQLHWLPVKQRYETSAPQVIKRLFTRVPCRGHSYRSTTGASWQLDRGYGTACRLRSDGKTLLLNIIGDHLRRICSFRLRRIVTFLLKCAGYKYAYSLTHSLTITC